MSRSARSCIVIGDLIDEDCAEVPAAIAGIAEKLAATKGGATLLCVPSSQGNLAEHLRQTLHEKYAIDLVLIPPASELLPGLDSPTKRSIATYHYLRQQHFHTVYFALEGGLPYYSLLARETGVYKTFPQIHVIAQSPIVWTSEAEKRFLQNTGQVTIAHMEKYCVETSDGLICSSNAILTWMRHKEWKLPANTAVIYPPIPCTWRQPDNAPAASANKTNELVFLSGPEYHKGLTLLCDALDNVAKDPPASLTVTMIGHFGRILGEHTGGMLLRRARDWPFELKLLPHMPAWECLSYLRASGALAVFPAYASSTNLWISACLEQSLPFVATNVGSTAELLSMESQATCLSEPTAKSLAQRIVEAVRSRTPRATPSSHWIESGDAWARHFAAIAAADQVKQIDASMAAVPDKQPLVSVVLVHHDRPRYLVQAIASIEQQDYQNLELILVDDGSTLADSHSTLEALESPFGKKGWKILREKNRYLGAARNTGVRAAKGAFILFLDDDNALFRSAISTLVRAAYTSGADICTCFRKTLYEENIPTSERSGFIQYTVLGDSLDIGFIENSFGDATALIRREVFDKVGYQVELFRRTGEDWEFYARAVLAGQKLRLVPEPLYWYRSSTRGMLRNSHWYDNHQPTLETFRKYGFRGLDHLYHLALSSHVSRWDIDRLHDNLFFSPWDSKFLQLCELEPESNEALDLLAEIAVLEGRPETASGLRARVRQCAGSGDAPASLKTSLSEISPPEANTDRRAGMSARPRAFECSPEDFACARLGVSHPSELPLMLFPREGGLFLRPSEMGPVTAVLDDCFPPFARRAVGFVEIAHEEASPFDFAMALTRSDQIADWSSEAPANCIAFSGWCRVADRFRLHEISLEMKQLAAISFTVNLAIRLPRTSNVSPSNAFWRKLVFEWDQ